MRHPFIYLPLLLFFSLNVQAAEIEALGQVPPKPVSNPYKIYRHYNLSKKEYTGKTVYYQKIPSDGYAEYMLIYYINHKNKIYAYIETYLDSNQIPIETNMQDFKENYQINVKKENSEYVITLTEEDRESKTYRQKAKDYVMLHMLERYIVQKMPLIIQQKEIAFVLFFPNLVNKSYMFSYFDFKAGQIKHSEDSGLRTIDIYPASFIVRKLLPDDKKKLTIIYDPTVNDIKTVIFSDFEYRLSKLDE